MLSERATGKITKNGVTMKTLNIKINKDGLTNEEIKKVRELINNELKPSGFKSLLNGNEFSVGVGGLKLEFSIN